MLNAMVVTIAFAGQVALSELTVPAANLPSGCHLILPGATQPPGTGRSSPIPPMNVTSNPLIGTDPTIVARIRERMEGAPTVPDAVPLSRRAAARYLLRWAEGIDEGYVAAYAQEGAPDVSVLALRFAAATPASHWPPAPSPREADRVAHVRIGTIVAFIYGDGGPCFRAVEKSIRSMGQ
jgi:hypothetical protein